jgi:hypothetical protein
VWFTMSPHPRLLNRKQVWNAPSRSLSLTKLVAQEGRAASETRDLGVNDVFQGTFGVSAHGGEADVTAIFPVRDAHNLNYITYIGNKLQLVHKGDDNTSLHSPLPVDETLYMRQPVPQGDDNTSLHSPLPVDETLYTRQPVRQGAHNTIQGSVLRLKKWHLHWQHKATYQRKL